MKASKLIRLLSTIFLVFVLTNTQLISQTYPLNGASNDNFSSPYGFRMMSSIDFHPGIDISKSYYPEKVYPVATGTIVKIESEGTQNEAVVIDHGNYTVRYKHIDSYFPNEYEFDKIEELGKLRLYTLSNGSTNYHLHFEYYPDQESYENRDNADHPYKILNGGSFEGLCTLIHDEDGDGIPADITSPHTFNIQYDTEQNKKFFRFGIKVQQDELDVNRIEIGLRGTGGQGEILAAKDLLFDPSTFIFGSSNIIDYNQRISCGMNDETSNSRLEVEPKSFSSDDEYFYIYYKWYICDEVWDYLKEDPSLQIRIKDARDCDLGLPGKLYDFDYGLKVHHDEPYYQEPQLAFATTSRIGVVGLVVATTNLSKNLPDWSWEIIGGAYEFIENTSEFAWNIKVKFLEAATYKIRLLDRSLQNQPSENTKSINLSRTVLNSEEKVITIVEQGQSYMSISPQDFYLNADDIDIKTVRIDIHDPGFENLYSDYATGNVLLDSREFTQLSPTSFMFSFSCENNSGDFSASSIGLSISSTSTDFANRLEEITIYQEAKGPFLEFGNVDAFWYDGLEDKYIELFKSGIGDIDWKVEIESNCENCDWLHIDPLTSSGTNGGIIRIYADPNDTEFPRYSYINLIAEGLPIITQKVRQFGNPTLDGTIYADDARVVYTYFSDGSGEGRLNEGVFEIGSSINSIHRARILFTGLDDFPSALIEKIELYIPFVNDTGDKFKILADDGSQSVFSLAGRLTLADDLMIGKQFNDITTTNLKQKIYAARNTGDLYLLIKAEVETPGTLQPAYGRPVLYIYFDDNVTVYQLDSEGNLFPPVSHYYDDEWHLASVQPYKFIGDESAILKAHDGFTNSHELFYRWEHNRKSTFINYDDIPLGAGENIITAVFRPTINYVSFQNAFEGFNSINGQHGEFKFKDPWLPDVNDTYGYRNAGIHAVPKPVSLPFNMDKDNKYRGVFKDQILEFGPVYGVENVETQNIDGKDFVFMKWQGNENVELPVTKALAVDVIFRGEPAVVTTLYKGTHVLNNSLAFSNSRQNKILKTSNSLYLFYESLGDTWYERSMDNGVTWSLMNNAKPIYTQSKSSHCTADVIGETVIVAYLDEIGNIYVSSIVDGNIINTKPDYDPHASSSNCRNPVIAVGSTTNENLFMIIWEQSEGLYYKIGRLESDGTIFLISSIPVKIQQTDVGSKYPSIAVVKYAGDSDVQFHLAWLQDNSEVHYCTLRVGESNSVTISAVTNLTYSGFSNYSKPVLTLRKASGAAGLPAIAFIGTNASDNDCAIVAMKNQTEGWSSLSFGDNVDFVNISAPFNNNDEFVLVWCEDNGNQSKYAKIINGQFVDAYNLLNPVRYVELTHGSTSLDDIKFNYVNSGSTPYSFETTSGEILRPTISGIVTDTEGNKMEGVQISFETTNSNVIITKTTESDGSYTHIVPYGWVGTVTATLDCYDVKYKESEILLKPYGPVNDDLTEEDWTADQIEYYVVATAGPGGSISPNDSVMVGCGDAVEFTIDPDTDYIISQILFDNQYVPVQNPFTINDITSDHTLEVEFIEYREYTITATSEECGKIAPGGEVIVGCGTDKTFNIYPSRYYQTKEVLVDGVSLGSIESYTFGNVIADHTIEVQYELISTPSIAPSIHNFEINSDEPTTAWRSVKLYIETNEYADKFMYSEDPYFEDADELPFSECNPYPFINLSPELGMKTVYVKVGNEHGWSEVVSDDIELILGPPAAPTFIVNGRSERYPDLTYQKDVVLSIGAIPTPEEYIVSELPDFSDTYWKPYTTSYPHFILSEGYGLKTVYAKLRNEIGETEVLSDDILYELSAPRLDFRINNNQTGTIEKLVTLNLRSLQEPTEYIASEDPNFSSAVWQPYTETAEFTLSDGFGMKTIYAKARNAAGESNLEYDEINYTSAVVLSGSVTYSSDATYEMWQTVIVEPGTYISISNGSKLTFGGYLQVNGTETEPVTFDFIEIDGGNGIHTFDNSEFLINYAIIKNAEVGIEMRGTGHLEIYNSKIYDCYNGFIIRESINEEKPSVIQDCEIYNNKYPGIKIIESNPIIDGNTLYNTLGNYQAISISENSPAVIKNNIISESPTGIGVVSNSGANVNNNEIYNCTTGIFVEREIDSDNVTRIDSNFIHNNQEGLYIRGYDAFVKGNNVYNNTIGIYVYGDGGIIDSNWVHNDTRTGTGIYLARARANVNRNIIDNFQKGVLVEHNDASILSLSDITNCTYGIFINGLTYPRDTLRVSYNSLTNNYYGVFSQYTENGVLIEGNDITNCGRDGVYLSQSNARIVSNNITNCNNYGIYCSGSGTAPFFAGNTISGNSKSGLYAYYFATPISYMDTESLNGHNVITENNLEGIYARSYSIINFGDASGNGGYNSIYNNSGAQAATYKYGEIYAMFNYWGAGLPPPSYNRRSYGIFNGSYPLDYDPNFVSPPMASFENISPEGRNLSVKEGSLASIKSNEMSNEIEPVKSHIINNLNSENGRQAMVKLNMLYKQKNKEGFLEFLETNVKNKLDRKSNMYAQCLEMENSYIIKQGRYSEAVANYKHIIDNFSNDEEIHKNALYSLCMLQYHLMDDVESAKATLGQLIAYYPEDEITFDAQMMMGNESVEGLNKLDQMVMEDTEKEKGVDSEEIPLEYDLVGNYPNPFNPSTTIRYALPDKSRVIIKIYDLTGSMVREIVKDSQGPGYYETVWDGRNVNGTLVSSGVYIYRFEASSLENDTQFIKNAKLMLMK